MTTTAAPLEEREVTLPWDCFIKDELVGRNPHLEDDNVKLEAAIANEKLTIEHWKVTEWAYIVKELKDFSFVIAEDIQPHWVSPARAVLWQRQTTRKREVNESGKVKFVDETTGWSPTKGQPIGNASQLAYYLRKGLRLRPPRDGVEDVRLLTELEATSPAEPLEEKPLAKYLDNRLPTGLIGFDTWKGYLRHCERHKLAPEQEPPDSIKRTMLNYEYFDVIRNKGFINRKAAWLHAKEIQRKTGMKAEVLLKSFKVNYDKNDSNSRESNKETLGSNDSKLNYKKAEVVVEKTVGTVEEA
jgi:hypothetical protein